MEIMTEKIRKIAKEALLNNKVQMLYVIYAEKL